MTHPGALLQYRIRPFYQPYFSPFPTNADHSTTATFPTRHRNQQPGKGQEKLKGPRAVPQCGGLDRPEMCGMTAPGPCVEGLYLAPHHCSSHGMAILAMQRGWLPSGEDWQRWKWLQAPPHVVAHSHPLPFCRY